MQTLGKHQKTRTSDTASSLQFLPILAPNPNDKIWQETTKTLTRNTDIKLALKGKQSSSMGPMGSDAYHNKNFPIAK